MNKTTKTYKSIEPIADIILEGTMLCIDPSTGSQSSMPGFALYEKGIKIESGIIEVDPTLNRSLRLYEISRCVREDFKDIDVLTVEYIPPVTYKGKGGMNSVSIMALQKSIGAIMAALPFEHLLEIPAASWKVYKPKEYEKTDEWDAICLGLCVVGIAEFVKGEQG